MSLISTIRFLWEHRPTAQQIADVKELSQAAEAFIGLLKSKLPDIEGKKPAIEAANQAFTQANLVLAKAAQDAAPPAAGG